MTNEGDIKQEPDQVPTNPDGIVLAEPSHNGEPPNDGRSASTEVEPAGLELVEVEKSTEVNPYQTREFLKLLHGHTPELLSYDLHEGFRHLHGALISADAKDFSKHTTRLADEVGEKLAGEQLGLLMEEADARLLGIAEQYGGTMVTAEGDGRRIFFPSLPDENSAEAVRRAVFVASQFQESAKTLPPVKFKDESIDLTFRVGVDCTNKGDDDLVVTSLGDDYLRCFAVFGEVIPRADALQRFADPEKHQVAVSSSVRQLLPKSYFKGIEAGNYVLSTLHGEDKPNLTAIELREVETDVPLEELNRFYEAHIPRDRRDEMKSAVVSAFEEGRPVEFKPSWEYPRVSTAFTKVIGLYQMTEKLSNGQSEAELYQQLNQPISRILHIVEQNNGSVERITGEGVVYSTFSGPSNEYHATRATYESGQVLVKHNLPFRAGISTDYAFSGVAGVDGNQTFTRVGKRVNESARLMQSAPENGVVISGTTHRRASHRLRCSEGGELELRGVGAVETFIVDKIDYRAGRYAEVEKIVGREKEEGKIDEVIDLAIATGKSQILVVEGEAGVGKTAVVSKSIANNLEAGRIYKIDVRSDEANRKLPLSTAKQFVHQLLDIPEDIEDPKDLEARILSRELPADITERMALLNAVLDTAFMPTDRVKWLDRTEQRAETLKLMQDILRLNRQSVGKEVPVIFVDDWQFIDKQSADLLVGFMTETADDGLVWAVPTRPSANDVEKVIIDGLKHNLPEQTYQLDIEPFPAFEPPEYPGEGATDAAKRDYYLKLRNAQITWFENNKEWVWPLVCSVFSMDEGELSRNKLAAAKVISRVFSKDASHGNIFYVQEILSHLAMSSDLGVSVFVQHPETGKWHFGDYPLPGETAEMVKATRNYYLTDEKQQELWEKVGTIVDIEEKKIAALSSNSQVVARAMSILGLESSRAMLLKITRMPERRLDMCLEEMLDHSVIDDLDGGYFGFVHRITQETIYNNIAKIEEKHSAHEAILTILETDYPGKQDKLSSKFFHAKNSGNLFKILEYADLYGRQLRNYGEESGAISVLERGVQAFDELERQGFPGMSEQQKLEAVKEQLERLLFIRFIWNSLARQTDEVATLESAHELFHRYYGGEDGREARPVEWAAYHAWILSDLGLRVGDKEPERAAREYYEVALDILKPFEQEGELDRLPDNFRRLIAVNLSNTYKRIGAYYRRSEGVDNLVRAKGLVEKAVYYARMTGDRDAVRSSLNGLGIIHQRLGELELANNYYSECLTLAEQDGDLPAQALYLNNQAEVMRGLGDENGAKAVLDRSLDITTRVFRPKTRAWSNLGLGSLYIALGDFITAEGYLDKANEFFVNTDIVTFSAISVDLAHCYLRAKQPNTLSARAKLASIKSDDKRIGMIGTYITAYADYIDGYIDLEDFIIPTAKQAEAFIGAGMDQSAMDAYRFLGEVIAKQDSVQAREFLTRALSLSEDCHAGVDKKMILASLESLPPQQ
ncbi:AAA family ATPase [Patescibacteria group bacterium]|nr:AAA family ATPase [Patescibacteria group bacterium]